MKFTEPKTVELTLLQELCAQFHVTLTPLEDRVLQRMDVGEIKVILHYELRKVLRMDKEKMDRIMQQLDKLDPIRQQLENNNNGDEAIKVHSKMKQLDYEYDCVAAHHTYFSQLVCTCLS